MQAIDDVLRPLEADDPVHCSELILVKKLLKGDASWATCKKRRLNRLAKSLAEIHPDRKRLALDKWYKLIGELRSMSIAIPGA
jgi:hypothetical protein